MYSLKGIKLYIFSIIRVLILSFKNFYFKSKFYNKKLITLVPERIFYNPSAHLSASLTSLSNDFFQLTNTSPENLWKISDKDKIQFKNLHSFLWLARIDRKDNKNITKKIIKSWISIFFNYHPKTWDMEITAKRIIAWSSNTDLTLEDSDKEYKKKFILCLIKQSNFLLKNLNNVTYDPVKIICCAAIILSGIIFKENDINYKIGIKELEKITKNYLDQEGFPKSRNPEEVFIYIQYLIIIKEWFKESQKPVPDFLKEIIEKCGSCYAMLSSSNKIFPLFNGATEVNHKDYDIFLKTLKYKFVNKKSEIAGLIKIDKKKIQFFIDCGNPPTKNFEKYYQAGCLSFELISNKQKIICNSGYGKYFSPQLSSLSQSTAAHSTLYINDTSSCVFQKNKFINKMYGNSLLEKHKIINKSYIEDKNFYSLSAAHSGYEKRFGCIHKRSIKIMKNEDKIFGNDELKRIKNNLSPLNYFIRFHMYPNTKIVKTQSKNSIIISLSNGEGWMLHTKINDFHIEKNIFLGNKNKIINNESVCISGQINKEIISIDWLIERIN